MKTRISRNWMVLLAGFAVVTPLAGCGGGDSPRTRDRGTSTAVKDTDDGDAGKDTGNGDTATATSTDDADRPPTGEWGSLKGRFVYEGTAPERKKLPISKDQEVCGKFDIRDESIVVGEDGGLANVMVWLRTDDAPVNPDYAATAEETIEVDNMNCRFEPHVIVLRVGQTLRIKNPDPIAHNSQILFRANSPFNENIPIGGQKDLKPSKEENTPVQVSCSIHPWMNSSLLLKESPYVAVSAADGTFEIANLPTGVDLEFQVYHMKAGNLSELSKDGEALQWKRGRFEHVIAAGENDLGEIQVDPKAFE